jgi:hypothetical protein
MSNRIRCLYLEVNMIRLSHFAVPATLGAALFVGAQGCSHEHPDAVPAAATELSAGTQNISGTAPKDGTVYVYDITANKSLYVGNVKSGDVIKVDAKQDKLFLNDKLITQRDDLRDSHRYKIFFDRSELERTQQQVMDEAARNRSSTIIQQPAQSGNTTVVAPQDQAQPASNTQQGTTVVVPQQQQPQPANNQGTTVVVPQQQQQPTNSQGTTVVVPPAPAPAK